MSRKAVSCKVSARLDNGTAVLANHSSPADPINASATAVDQAALDTAVTANDATVTANEAKVVVLEGDGASPTQAHVNAMRVTWDAMKATWATVKTARTTLEADIALVPGQADVVISYNATTVVSRDTLRQAVNELLAMLPKTL